MGHRVEKRDTRRIVEDIPENNLNHIHPTHSVVYFLSTTDMPLMRFYALMSRLLTSSNWKLKSVENAFQKRSIFHQVIWTRNTKCVHIADEHKYNIKRDDIYHWLTFSYQRRIIEDHLCSRDASSNNAHLVDSTIRGLQMLLLFWKGFSCDFFLSHFLFWWNFVRNAF